MGGFRPMERAVSHRRSRAQIYVDVLRSIHINKRCNKRLTWYQLERDAGLTHTRLRKLLRDLQDAKFIDESLSVTVRGYAFLSEISGKVIPILEKYDLWRE